MNTIEQIFEEQNPQDGVCPEWAKNLALEFGKQLLREVAVNVKIRMEPAHFAEGSYLYPAIDRESLFGILDNMVCDNCVT